MDELKIIETNSG